MGDRLHFRALVVASLTSVYGLPLVVAMGAMSDHADLYDTGLPAEDAAAMVFFSLKGERRFEPRA